MLLAAVEGRAYVYIEFPALCDLQNLNILASLGLVWCCIRNNFGFGASLNRTLRSKGSSVYSSEQNHITARSI